MADETTPREDDAEMEKNAEAIQWHERTEQVPRGGRHDREDDERLIDPPPPHPI